MVIENDLKIGLVGNDAEESIFFVAFCYFYCDCDCKRFNKMKKNRKSLHFYDKNLQFVRIIAEKVISLSS